MRKKIILALAAAMLATGAYADDCDHEAARRIATSASGISKIVITGKGGTLKVEGRAGVSEVVASGTACASQMDMLKQIDLRARRNGSELRIEAVIPDQRHGFFDGWWDQARLDFTVVVPAGIDISVEDGSGSTEILNVGNLTVRDGSGELDIRGVRGNLDVTDGSGSLEIENVDGDIRVVDGSGSIQIERVGGAVLIDEDGSGSIEISDVKRNVTIGDDGSGGVRVTDVGGDLIVREKGSGRVGYNRISGRVQVPRED
jgi:hypothetical protein